MRAYRFSPPQFGRGELRGRRAWSRIWLPRAAAGMAAATGCYSLAAGDWREFGPAVQPLAVVAPAVAGLGLILAAVDLWHRKRVAWQFGVALFYGLALFHLISGRGIEAGEVFVAATVVLSPMGPLFDREARALPLGPALRRTVLAASVAAVYALAEPAQRPLDLWEAALIPATPYAAAFGIPVYVVAAVAGVYGLIVLFPSLRGEFDFPVARRGGSARLAEADQA